MGTDPIEREIPADEQRAQAITDVLVDPAAAVAELERLRKENARLTQYIERAWTDPDYDRALAALDARARAHEDEDGLVDGHNAEVFEGGQRLCPKGRDDCGCLDRIARLNAGTYENRGQDR